MRSPSLFQTWWTAPIFLVPFLTMLAIHQVLGLSDALLAADAPGARPAHGFNLLMGINMNLCVLSAMLHVAATSQRAWRWIGAKLLVSVFVVVLGLVAL